MEESALKQSHSSITNQRRTVHQTNPQTLSNIQGHNLIYKFHQNIPVELQLYDRMTDKFALFIYISI